MVVVLESIAMRVRWCGLDFGETVMNPYTLHQSKIIAEIYEELGRKEEARGRVAKWYELRDTFGGPGDRPEQRVRQLKQYAKDRIYAEVLGGDPRAARLYDEKEAKGFTPTGGVASFLGRLKRSGVEVAVVSESSSLAASLAISRFLEVHHLSDFFGDIFTPVGRFHANGELLSSGFAGATKRSGTLYDLLGSLLRERGVTPAEGAMVGDDPLLDVEYPKLRGFVGIQYTGVVDRGRSESADYTIASWEEFPDLF